MKASTILNRYRKVNYETSRRTQQKSRMLAEAEVRTFSGSLPYQSTDENVAIYVGPLKPRLVNLNFILYLSMYFIPKLPLLLTIVLRTVFGFKVDIALCIIQN